MINNKNGIQELKLIKGHSKINKVINKVINKDLGIDKS